MEPHLEHDHGLAAIGAAAPSRLQHVDAMGGAGAAAPSRP